MVNKNVYREGICRSTRNSAQQVAVQDERKEQCIKLVLQHMIWGQQRCTGICARGELIPILISTKSLPPQDVTPTCTPMCTSSIHQRLCVDYQRL